MKTWLTSTAVEDKFIPNEAVSTCYAVACDWSEANKYEDLTPSGGGSGSSDRPILTVNTIIKSEYATNERIVINYSWTSQNSGAGRVYGILDGTTKLSRRENPMNESGESSRDWEIGQLSRGKHNIELYVNDSKNLQSDRYRAKRDRIY